MWHPCGTISTSAVVMAGPNLVTKGSPASLGSVFSLTSSDSLFPTTPDAGEDPACLALLDVAFPP